MTKTLPMVEFYITNVCNLTCRGCNRFNNYNFKGHQYWDEYAEAYTQWSKRLDIENIWILGGEPTLHPQLETWVKNLRLLWPNSKISIQSNGTYVKPEYLEFWKKYQTAIIVAAHDQNKITEIKNNWKGQAHTFEAFVFHESTVVERNNKYTVHCSDTQKAFEFCDMKHDHTMYKGNLYKCPVTAILPDFDQQFNLDINPSQRALLESYQPLSSHCSEQELLDFIDSRHTAIPQCQFCPQRHVWHTALGELQTNLPAPSFKSI